MKNKIFIFLISLWTALSMVCLSDIAQAKVYIDIDAPGFQQFPIAVCDFQNNKTGTPPSDDEGVVLADHIRRLLDLSGIFNILDKKSFLDGVESQTPEVIRFSDWSVIGADFLLRGDLAFGAEGLRAASRLYDVTRGQTLFQKTYAYKTGDLRAAARAVASDVLVALTGDEGDFNTQIAFVIKKDARSDIHTLSYDAADLKNLTGHQSIVTSPRWSPDGQYLAFTSYKNGRPEVYLRSLKTGKERKVAAFRGLNLCGSFSPDSRKLLLTLSKDDNEEIYSLDIETLALQRLTRSYAIDVSPAWSPDGRKIAFVSNRSGSPQIFVMDADGNNVRRVTYEGNYNTSPSWSPRGGRIAYEGLINRKYQIFSVDEEGNNLIQLTFDDADNEYPSWSPSGRQIVFSSQRGSKSRISIMNANGLNVRVLREGREQMVMPSWSPRLK
ncbi:MAG: Tol-Pal system beta propeller repeat protein TolB [Smithellaceae bacterium]|nr:Tol-Pal system beta propeller repeat protein TolB [Syntrophaceae bacterium]MDD4242312.1 Tol-Pal system beta propeller repeat protein TolB [Smithellaceae bacterium]NLX51570.1 Tol-Pal system beta propeller repeat protein TolB [Deltaproteobacteria bacterium]